MITTKYNFKNWLHKTYPDITATPIYGIPAYLLSKPMDALDNYKYNLQTLKDGRHIVFIGISLSEIKPLLQKLNDGTPIVTERFRSNAAPTTFSAFELWLDKHGISPLNRTFCNHVTASQALMTKDINNCSTPDEVKTWYMYELPISNGTSLNDTEKEWYSKVPYAIIQNGDYNIVIVLIKACNSTYKSKRQRFAEKFSLMQPLYEQLISLAARAGAMDEIQPGSAAQEWDKAKLICEQYMSIQFDQSGHVDLEEMKEACNNGTIGLWTRERSNLKGTDDEDPEDF